MLTGHVGSTATIDMRANDAAREHRLRRWDYDLELVGPAPQPPHERAWRHPSELAPSTRELDAPASGGRALVLATGVTAAMLVAVMVVALTPPRSDAPTAVSATTLPALTVQLRSSALRSTERSSTAAGDDSVRIGNNTMMRDNALALVGSPNAVSAGPVDARALDVGQRLPDGSEQVYVLTQSHTYLLRWSQVDRLVAPDGSAVITADGELLALFVDGRVRILVD